MMTLADTNNKSSIRITLPQAGVLVSVTSLIVFVTGFFSGYTTFRSEIDQVKYDIVGATRNLNDIQTRLNGIHNEASQERAILSGRLAGLENEVKWIKEGVAELKLRSLGVKSGGGPP